MIRRPPRSTPFPTRRSSDLVGHVGGLEGLDAVGAERQLGAALGRAGSVRVVLLAVLDPAGDQHGQASRSEEHTSELQSRQYLVCRLLLEKKQHTPYNLLRSN